MIYFATLQFIDKRELDLIDSLKTLAAPVFSSYQNPSTANAIEGGRGLFNFLLQSIEFRGAEEFAQSDIQTVT